MGDPLREQAFDAAYAVSGDVGEAEEYANEAMAKIRRSRRRLAGLGASAVALFVFAAAVVIVGNGGTASPALRTTAQRPVDALVDQTTTT